MNASTLARRADRLIAEADAAARRYSPTDSLDRLAFHVGHLGGTVRSLCAELAQFENQSKREKFTVELDGIEYQVGAAFDRDDRDTPLVVDGLDVYIRGVDVSRMLSMDLLREIEGEVLRQHEAESKRIADDRAIQAYLDRRAA